jgi:co-chaperonin GroES (HSP10)
MEAVAEVPMTELERKWLKEKESKMPSLMDAYDESGKFAPQELGQEVIDRIPVPTGWRIAILPYRGTQKSKGGIILSDETQKRTQLATTCGYVLRLGPLAYKDQDKFPTGAWCAEGDWVLFGRYAGARIAIDGGEIRLLNDDEILGRVNDPEDVLHIS